MATLPRRHLLAAAPAALLAACEPGMRLTASNTPKVDQAGLQRAVSDLAASAAPATLGVALMNLESGETFAFNGDRPFPMQSVFKLPLGAAALAEADAGRLNLDERVTLQPEQLSAPRSPIGEAWPARRDFSWRELLVSALTVSDNTAADVLMKRIGGPGAVTAWLQGRRVPAIRVDRYERELQPDVYGMPSFRPQWRTGAAFSAAKAAVPPERRMQAMRAYLADPRDTATPNGMLEFLNMLNREELVSPASTQLLLRILFESPSTPNRIRAGLPPGARVAHKSGSSGSDQGLTPATNDVGIIVLRDRRAYALAVFLAGSTAEEPAREALIAQVTRATVRAVG